MKGLELARAYYETCGKPMIRERFSAHAGRIAAGLDGEGSECFGFDDAISTDHDYGPSFCLWLTPRDFQEIGPALHQAYAELPGEFRGFPARRDGEHSGGRVGVFAVDAWYRSLIGRPDAELSPLEWLHMSESRLALATNGRVFDDTLGEFTAIRRKLLAFYPEDVRLKKIAARAAGMAQSGQYNYARSMCRGETLAARLALDEFIRQTASMVFLLNRRYAPFYKWLHRAMRDLPLLGEACDLLAELSLSSLRPEVWRYATPREMLLRLNTGDANVLLVERLCALVLDHLRENGLTDGNDSFLANHAGNIVSHIKDAAIRSRHILEG